MHLAAGEAANTVARLRHVNVDELTSPEPLHEVDKLFTHADARAVAIIEQGRRRAPVLVSVKVPRIVDSKGRLVSRIRGRYVRISAPIDTEVLAIARGELRPPAVTPLAPAGANGSRKKLAAVIQHRPPRRGPER